MDDARGWPWPRLVPRRSPAARRLDRLFAHASKYERPRSMLPLLAVNVAGFYTGVVLAAVTEQLYKENYWEEHPGEAVPMMRSWIYQGKHRIRREDFAEEGDDK